MCTWFYADYKSLSPIIDKAQQLPLAFSMMNAMSKPKTMSGNIRPTDMAAVFAPNKQGNMAVFPMIWGFTVEQSSKPLILGKDSLREWVRPDSDSGRIAKKALTNMVMEKAIDYPEPKPAFLQI